MGFLTVLVLALGSLAQNSSTPDKPAKKTLAAKSCGQSVPPNIEGMKRLRLIPRLSSLVDNRGFTQEEFEKLMSHDELQDQAADFYGFAYVMWKKPFPRDKISEMIDKSFQKGLAGKSFSSAEKIQLDTFLPKYKNMMVQAFDMGHADANRRPCPY